MKMLFLFFLVFLVLAYLIIKRVSRDNYSYDSNRNRIPLAQVYAHPDFTAGLGWII